MQSRRCIMPGGKSDVVRARNGFAMWSSGARSDWTAKPSWIGSFSSARGVFSPRSQHCCYTRYMLYLI